MKKPNFLKTRKEKREDRLVRLAVLTTELAVALKERKERDEMRELQKESQRLENENQGLRNRLLELELEKKKSEA